MLTFFCKLPMSLIISQSTPVCDGVVGCLSINIDNIAYTLIAKPFLLEFYNLNASGDELKAVQKFETNYKVLTLAKIRPCGQNTDWVLLINEVDQLIVMCPRESRNHVLELTVIENFPIIDHLRIQAAIDDDRRRINVGMIKPRIEVDPRQRFIAIHITKGFIVILTLNPQKSRIFHMSSNVIIPAQVKRNRNASELEAFKIFETPYTLPTGSGEILNIKFVHSCALGREETWLAVIQLDTDLHHVISWFNIELDDHILARLNCKSFTLNDACYLIQAVANGLLVITPSALNFYPIPTVHLGCNLTDVVVRGGIASKCWLMGDTVMLGKVTELYSNTILFCSQKGFCFMINIETCSFYENNTTILSSDITSGLNYVANIKINDWTVKFLGCIHMALDFLSRNGDLIFGISKYKGGILFDPYNIKHNNHMIYQSDTFPISFLSFHHRKRISIIKGNYISSKLCYKGHLLEIKDKVIKDIVFIDNTNLGLIFVILVESYTAGKSMEMNQIHNQLLVYDSDLHFLSSHDFDESCNCSNVLSLDQFKYTGKRNSDATDNSIDDSLLTVCNFMDTIGSEKSEIALFKILEDGKLEQQTSLFVNREINSALILNNQKCILLGPNSVSWLSISSCNEGDTYEHQTPRINLRSEMCRFPCSYITHLERLSPEGKEILAADSFGGLYYIQLEDTENTIKRIVHLISHLMITDFTKVGVDGLAVCDVFGNLYLLQISNTRKLFLIKRFNLVPGAIGVVDSELKDSDQTLKAILNNKTKLTLCTVGTIDGSVINVFCCSGDNQLINHLGQIQTDLTKKYKSTLDNENESFLSTEDYNQKVPKSEDSLCDMNLARSKYIRLPYGVEQPHIIRPFQTTTKFLDIIDTRYIKRKLELYCSKEKHCFYKLLYNLGV